MEKTLHNILWTKNDADFIGPILKSIYKVLSWKLKTETLQRPYNIYGPPSFSTTFTSQFYEILYHAIGTREVTYLLMRAQSRLRKFVFMWN